MAPVIMSFGRRFCWVLDDWAWTAVEVGVDDRMAKKVRRMQRDMKSAEEENRVRIFLAEELGVVEVGAFVVVTDDILLLEDECIIGCIV